MFMAATLAREATIHQARYPYAWVWPPFYLLAGLACVWFHTHPRNRHWWKWSGSILVGAYVSRGLIIIQAALLEGWSYRYLIGAGTWFAWAGVVAQLWLHQFRPER